MKVNSSRYQVISQIARNVLVIHVSIVASKFAFSTGGEGGWGRVLDSFCSSLSSITIEALICTQNWLKDAKTKKTNKASRVHG